MFTKPQDEPQAEGGIQQPENPLPPYTLENLSERMRAAVDRMGWTELSPVQSYALPYMHEGRDIMAQARTGSGKTGAFILPMLDQLNPNQASTQGLVLVPTRELAQQVTEEAQRLAGDSGIRVVPVFGGSSYKRQLDGFKKGAHIVVGTPGRILDHLLRRSLKLDKLKILVFDEADRMLSMGFYPDMRQLQGYLPKGQLNGHMFSATFPTAVKRLAQQFLNEPGFLSLSRDHVHVEDTDHVYYVTPGMDKDRSLVRIIEVENPGQAIIFCNTKDRVHYVARVLQRFGYNADQLSSDLNQNKREKVLGRLRDGKLRFLVATDVAARGIDIPELSHVIQFEPPQDLEDYIHRAGRTGRAGATGTAILLLNSGETNQVKRLSGRYKIEFTERPLPTSEDLGALVAERLENQLEAQLRDRDKLQTERMQRFEPLLEKLLTSEEGKKLVIMLLDDTYHAWMHKPPELPPITTSAPKKKGGGGRHGGGNRGGGKRRSGGDRKRGGRR